MRRPTERVGPGDVERVFPPEVCNPNRYECCSFLCLIVCTGCLAIHKRAKRVQTPSKERTPVRAGTEGPSCEDLPNGDGALGGLGGSRPERFLQSQSTEGAVRSRVGLHNCAHPAMHHHATAETLHLAKY